jgi:Domain of unknown function (DUF4157)
MSDYEIGRVERRHQVSRDVPRPKDRERDPRLTADGPASSRGTAAMLELQRTVGNAGVVQMLADEAATESPVLDVVGSGGGQPLHDSTRDSMESAFGQSFADVRVHTDEQASGSAESVGANAYTVGNDIVFKSGQFDPSSEAGQKTLAHELTHVVQQRSGPVDGSDAPGGIRLSDPSDRFERAADETASQVVADPSVGAAATASAGGDTATAQREMDDEGQAIQRTVQRQDVSEEDQEPGTS